MQFRDFYGIPVEGSEGRPLSFLYTDSLNFVDDVVQEGGPVLIATIDATYSGYLLNSRVYPGKYMRNKDCWGTWMSEDRGGVAGYDKPVLTHHDQHSGDPIGRVIDASYIQLWDDIELMIDYQIPTTDYEKGSGVIRVKAQITDKDAVIKILDGRYNTVSSGQRSDHAWCSICGHDWAATDEPCEHIPGRIYKPTEEDADKKEEEAGSRMYIITGPLDYGELSYVNLPANKQAKTIAVELLKGAEDSLDLNHADMLGFTNINCYNSLVLVDQEGRTTELIRKDGEPDVIPYGDKNIQRKTLISGVDLPDNLPALEKDDEDDPTIPMDPVQFAVANVARTMIRSGLFDPEDEEGACESTLFSNLTAFMTTITAKAGGHQHVLHLELDVGNRRITGFTGLTDKGDRHDHFVDMDIKDLNETSFKGETRDATRGGSHTHSFDAQLDRDKDKVTYRDMIRAVRRLESRLQNGQLSQSELKRLAIQDGDEKFLLDKDLYSDAKLSTTKRKKLSSKTFCGPNRSFPVPDCSHVTAARRLIGRAKVAPETKSRIMACVNRKSKSMGCGGGKDSTTAGDTYSRFLNGEKDMAEEAKPKVDPNKGPTKDKAPAEGGGASKTTDEILTDKVNELETTNKELQRSLSERQEQLQNTLDENSQLKESLSKQLATDLVLCRVVLQHPDVTTLVTKEDFDKKVTEYAERSTDSLGDAVTDALPTVLNAMKDTSGKPVPSFLKTKTPGDSPAVVHKDETNDKPVEKEIDKTVEERKEEQLQEI